MKQGKKNGSFPNAKLLCVTIPIDLINDEIRKR